MRIKVIPGEGKGILIYDGEWELLEERYKAFGLERRKSENLFGLSLKGEFYYGGKEPLIHYFSLSQEYVDDINAPPLSWDAENHVHRVNIGILRIVPNEGIITLPLKTFVDKYSILALAKSLRTVLTFVCNISFEEFEIIIRKKEKEKEKEEERG